MSLPLVVTAGHICLDIIPRILSGTSDAFLAPGRLTDIDGVDVVPGGCVPNTGLVLARLGVPVRLVGRIGDDAVGRLLAQTIEECGTGLAVHRIAVPGAAGATTIVIAPPGFDRTFLHCAGPNDAFAGEDIDDNTLQRAGVMHLGYPPLLRRLLIDDGQELAAIFRRAKAAGVTTSLDMAMPDPTRASGRADWRRILGGALPFVDVFAPGAEELLYAVWRDRYGQLASVHGYAQMLAALSDADLLELADRAVALGAHIAMVKLGARGIMLRSGKWEGSLGRGVTGPVRMWQQRCLWAPAFQVQVAGTVGAGDAAIAGFLAAMVRGCSPEASLVAAAAVGALRVESGDARRMPAWEDVQTRCHGPWEQLDAGVSAPPWRWDAAARLWRHESDGKGRGRSRPSVSGTCRST